MSLCDNCIHDDVCGLEDNHEEGLVFCDDMILKEAYIPKHIWFSINEKLPEESERVLISVNGKKGKMVRSATYLGGSSKSFWSDTGEFWDMNKDKDKNNLIAWMPLPEPYDEVKVQ